MSLMRAYFAVVAVDPNGICLDDCTCVVRHIRKRYDESELLGAFDDDDDFTSVYRISGRPEFLKANCSAMLYAEESLFRRPSLTVESLVGPSR